MILDGFILAVLVFLDTFKLDLFYCFWMDLH